MVLDRRVPRGRGFHARRAIMLWTIFVILLVLWLLGMVSSYTLGGYIHVLLVIAIVTLLIRVIQGRPVA
jgi:asparagine N-glycosylation enzyme membrane subunit Stt3